MHFSLPNNVINIIDTLENAGFEAWCVGGCVRDMLLGVTPDDFDITTSARPNQIKELFANTVDTGLKHGTVTVIIDHTPFEVTTYRTDGDYKDHRSPESVEFVSDIKEDLSRRDFTVNAFAYHHKRGLLDMFGGIKDIKAKILRAVGEPKRRFSEDALRILRLFRFSSVLGFGIEEQTLSSALECAAELESISCERIATEFFKILLSSHPENSLFLLNSSALGFLGIKKADFSGFSSLPYDRFIRFAAFCKNSCIDGEELCNQLKTDNELKKYCKCVSRILHVLPKTVTDIKISMRDYGEKETADALTLSGKDNSTVEKIIASGEPYLISHLKINGSDLISEGLSGELIGKALKSLSDAVIKDATLNTKENLITLIRQ